MDEVNLSTNVNPLGPPRWFDEVFTRSGEVMRSYQPLWHDALDEKLSSLWGTGPRSTFAIPGTSSFLHALPHLLALPSASCVVLRPTFWEYEEMARLNGWTVHTLSTLGLEVANSYAGPSFISEVDDFLTKTRPDVVILCEPNNPTGTSLGRSAIEKIAVRHPEMIFLVDQTYAIFCQNWLDRRLPRTGSPHNLFSLTSLSKLFCLPGLRIGVASFADPQRAERVRRLLGPVRVDSLAAEVLPLLLADDAYLLETQNFVRREWDFLSDALSEFDSLQVNASDTLFRFVEVRNRTAAGQEHPGTWLAAELRRRHIRVLDGAVYGVPTHIRLRVAKRDHNIRLLEALREVLL